MRFYIPYYTEPNSCNFFFFLGGGGSRVGVRGVEEEGCKARKEGNKGRRGGGEGGGVCFFLECLYDIISFCSIVCVCVCKPI